MKKLNIAMFTDSFFPFIDGVAMVIDNYASRLSKKANVYLFAPEIDGLESDDSKYPYTVIRCKSKKLFFIDYSLPLPILDSEFKEKLNQIDADIVHIHSPFGIGKLGLDYARKKNIPSVATLHSQYWQDFERSTKSKRISKLLTNMVVDTYNKADVCWTVNHEVARVFHEDFGYKKLPEIVNNASEMLPLENKDEAIKYINDKYNINKNDFVMLFVGRINKLKNIFFIVDILEKLNKEYQDFKMLFVGDGQDLEDLENYIKEKNLQNKIITCGKVMDRKLLAYHYARADLFLFPSLYDTNAIVQIEAASQKTPSMLIKGSCTAALIENNKSGFLVDYEVDAFKDKILELIHDKEELASISEGAYKYFYKNWDEVADLVYDKYIKLIKEYK